MDYVRLVLSEGKEILFSCGYARELNLIITLLHRLLDSSYLSPVCE